MKVCWDDENKALLTKLYNEGLSSKQIAPRIRGATRNAIIGKLSRMGLTNNYAPPRKYRPRAPKPEPETTFFKDPPRRGPEDSQPLGGRASIAPQPDARPEVFVEETEPPSRAPASILTLNYRTCRWPIGDPRDDDFHFCGKTKPLSSKPYCESHEKKAHSQRYNIGRRY